MITDNFFEEKMYIKNSKKDDWKHTRQYNNDGLGGKYLSPRLRGDVPAVLRICVTVASKDISWHRFLSILVESRLLLKCVPPWSGYIWSEVSDSVSGEVLVIGSWQVRDSDVEPLGWSVQEVWPLGAGPLEFLRCCSVSMQLATCLSHRQRWHSSFRWFKQSCSRSVEVIGTARSCRATVLVGKFVSGCVHIHPSKRWQFWVKQAIFDCC